MKKQPATREKLIDVLHRRPRPTHPMAPYAFEFASLALALAAHDRPTDSWLLTAYKSKGGGVEGYIVFNETGESLFADSTEQKKPKAARKEGAA